MVLSNAERQRRFRERIKAKASGADLPGMVRETITAGLRAAFSMYQRTNTADLDLFPNVEAAIDRIANPPKGRAAARAYDPLDDLLGWLDPDWEEFTADEREAVMRAREVVQAVLLRNA